MSHEVPTAPTGTNAAVSPSASAMFTRACSVWLVLLVCSAVAQSPIITVHPQNQVVCVGANPAFQVQAIGAFPLSFQWRRDGTNTTIGVTSFPNASVLVVANAHAADAASSFEVTVSNSFGQATSTVAVLRVPDPGITQQPTNTLTPAGGVITFMVTPCGTGPFNYQWFFRDVKLVNAGRVSGANSDVLNIAGAGTGDNGQYQVVVHNAWGAIHSQFAECEVDAPPVITFQPQNQASCNGGNATFQVEATGTLPMHFQWRRDNTNVFENVVSSPTNSSLTLAGVFAFDNAPIEVTVTNVHGQAGSIPAFLHFPYPNPAISSQPTNTVVSIGAHLMLGVLACGDPWPLSYQWFKVPNPLTNDFRISGANTDLLTISNANTNDSGSYVVVVGDWWGVNFTTSAVARCFVGDPPTVGSLTSRVVRFRTNTTFNPVYGGDLPRFYQWFRNDVPILGANDPTLPRNLVQRPAVGLYHVSVANGAGVAVSEKAHLQVRLTLEGNTPVFREEATDVLDSLTNAVPSLFDPPATTIHHGVPLLFTTYGAAAQAWEVNHCGVPASRTMWVAHDSHRSGLTRVSTEGSTFDTVLAVYTWDQPNENPRLVQCDNDSGYDGRTSLLHFTASANQTYYIAVDGVAGATGLVRLEVGVGEVIRKLRFNPANSTVRFEWAGPFWTASTLRETTNLTSPVSWSSLMTLAATNADRVIGYTNSTTSASRRFYSVQVQTP